VVHRGVLLSIVVPIRSAMADRTSMTCSESGSFQLFDHDSLAEQRDGGFGHGTATSSPSVSQIVSQNVRGDAACAVDTCLVPDISNDSIFGDLVIPVDNATSGTSKTVEEKSMPSDQQNEPLSMENNCTSQGHIATLASIQHLVGLIAAEGAEVRQRASSAEAAAARLQDQLAELSALCLGMRGVARGSGASGLTSTAASENSQFTKPALIAKKHLVPHGSDLSAEALPHCSVSMSPVDLCNSALQCQSPPWSSSEESKKMRRADSSPIAMSPSFGLAEGPTTPTATRCKPRGPLQLTPTAVTPPKSIREFADLCEVQTCADARRLASPHSAVLPGMQRRLRTDLRDMYELPKFVLGRLRNARVRSRV